MEDASRRDLTINALFYNVSTRQVEDYTGKGLSDLNQRIARTPLAPLQTFHDDPLRVLRCVRFSSRYSLKIQEDVEKAIQDEGIKAALESKVSKERVGIEVMKMINKTPALAMRLMARLGLLDSVFSCTGMKPTREEVMPYCEILEGLEAKGEVIHPWLWLAAATVPFDGFMVPLQGKKGKEISAVADVISIGLKVSWIRR